MEGLGGGYIESIYKIKHIFNTTPRVIYSLFIRSICRYVFINTYIIAHVELYKKE